MWKSQKNYPSDTTGYEINGRMLFCLVCRGFFKNHELNHLHLKMKNNRMKIA